MSILPTNKLVKFLALFCGSGVLLLILFPLTTTAAFTKQINYQGKLTNSGGAAVANGSYSVVFKIYNDPIAGSTLWTETQPVVVTSGLFSVMLGSVSSLNSVDFNQPVYLTLNVNGDGEMVPRKTLGSVPNAFNSLTFDGLSTSSVAVLNRENTFTATNTFSDLIVNGNIGIGTTTPSEKLVVDNGGINSFNSFNDDYWDGSATTTYIHSSIFKTGYADPVTNLSSGVYGYATSTDFNKNGNYVSAGVFGESDFIGVAGQGMWGGMFTGVGDYGIGGQFNGSYVGLVASSRYYGASLDGGYLGAEIMSDYADGLNVYSPATVQNGFCVDYPGFTNQIDCEADSKIWRAAGSPAYAIRSTGGLNYFGGNVGIGTTTPLEKLVVDNGNINAFNSTSSEGIDYLGTFKTNAFEILGTIGKGIFAGVYGNASSSDRNGYISSGLFGKGYLGVAGEGNIGIFGASSQEDGMGGYFMALGTSSTGVISEVGGDESTGLSINSGGANSTGLYIENSYYDGGDTYGADIKTNSGTGLSVNNSSSTGYSIYSTGGLNLFEESTTFGKGVNTFTISPMSLLGGGLTGMELSGTTNVGEGLFSIKNGLFIRGADGDPFLNFMDSDLGSAALIGFATSTGILSFESANGYNFDESLVVDGTVKASCFSNDGGATCITGGGGGGGGDYLWSTTSVSGLVIHPSVSNSYPVVIGDNATTSDSIFEVNGNSKLRNNLNIGGNLVVTGNATISGLTNKFLSVNGSGQVVGTTTPVLTELDPYYTVASSTLLRFGTSSDTLTEGTINKFWTNAKFDARLAASTSLPNLATLSGLSTIGSSTGVTKVLGKLGIGTSTPSAMLDIYNTGSNAGLFVEGGVSGVTIAQMKRSGASGVDFKWNGASGNASQVWGTGGVDRFTTGVMSNGASYRVAVGGALGTGDALTILSTGNVGIGTTTPMAFLDVDNGRSLINYTDIFSGRTTTMGSSSLLSLGYKISNSGLGSIIMGANSSSSLPFSFSYGTNNGFSGLFGSFSTVFGSDNQVFLGNSNFLAGRDNYSHILGKAVIFGADNDVSGLLANAYVFGDRNTSASLGGDNYILGASNNLTGGNNFAFGFRNNLDQQGSYVFGSDNYNEDGIFSTPSYILGSNSTTTTGDAFVFGRNLLITATGTALFGLNGQN